MTKIAIVGAGLMGSATSFPLSDNGHTVRLVGTHLDNETIQSCKEMNYHPRLKRHLAPNVKPFYIGEIAEALDGVEIILSGVNSLGVHWMGKTLGPHIQAGQTIIAITKGLEVDDLGNLTILPDVLRSELPDAIQDQVSYAAVGGPCIAGELAGRRNSLVVFGSRNQEIVDKLANIFRTSYYHVWTTTDLIGLEICAALKNAYTLAVGMATGLLEKSGGVDNSDAYMFNLAAGIFGESATEIHKALQLTGANPSLAYGLPGVGDMYVTCMGGRTVRLGKLIGEGNSYAQARMIMAGETLESVEIIRVMGDALPVMESKGLITSSDFPLMRFLIETIVNSKTLEIPFAKFFGGLQRLQ
jgi:glycerol-3-phosphate dehydrogenase (NAD(P)+)